MWPHKKNFFSEIQINYFLNFFLDRHHFDNPVYSFNANVRDDGSMQPLNNIQKIQVKNNLTKNNNLERQKLDDEEMALKNGKKYQFFEPGLAFILSQ